MPKKKTVQEPEVVVVAQNSWVGIFGLALALAIGASGFVFLYLMNEIVNLNRELADVSHDVGVLQTTLLSGDRAAVEEGVGEEDEVVEPEEEEIVIPEGYDRFKHNSADGDKDFAV